MNLTRKKHKEHYLAKSFFSNVIMPLAVDLKAKEKSFFPLEPNITSESYFSKPKRSIMNPKDFELSAVDSIEDFLDEISELWKAEGNLELTKLIAGLEEIARELAIECEQEEDISPFIYVMF